MNYKKLGLILVATTVLGSSSAFANLVITPTFSAGINGDANSTQIKATINQAINFFQTHYSDNIVVNINFDNANSGLGSSSTSFIFDTFANFRAKLLADVSTADDTLAMANLAAGPNNPASGSANIALSTANAKALGYSIGAGADSSINLNTAICNLVHGTNTNAGFYDLYAVACHEIDEALGTVSLVGDPFGNSRPSSADMFRYNAGAHSWDTSTTHAAFFSIDGTNNIVEYNQLGRTTGDWGDWRTHSPAQVQDWAGSPGVTVDMGASETRLLDVVGYNYINPVPEPATVLALGLGAVALIRRRKK